jgi:hypothetical protein
VAIHGRYYSDMNRRNYLLLQSSLIAGIAMADAPKISSLDDGLRWLDKLDKASDVRSTSAWTMRAVLEHMGQSIEMSIDGYPEHKSAPFKKTAGAAAFAFFGWRGRMSHSLTEPIPGAPALAQLDDWKPGAARLRAAIARFQTHNGPLKPHFAYGDLDKNAYALAHTLHIANHQDEIVVV